MSCSSGAKPATSSFQHAARDLNFKRSTMTSRLANISTWIWIMCSLWSESKPATFYGEYKQYIYIYYKEDLSFHLVFFRSQTRHPLANVLNGIGIAIYLHPPWPVCRKGSKPQLLFTWSHEPPPTLANTFHGIFASTSSSSGVGPATPSGQYIERIWISPIFMTDQTRHPFWPKYRIGSSFQLVLPWSQNPPEDLNFHVLFLRSQAPEYHLPVSEHHAQYPNAVCPVSGYHSQFQNTTRQFRNSTISSFRTSLSSFGIPRPVSEYSPSSFGIPISTSSFQIPPPVSEFHLPVSEYHLPVSEYHFQFPSFCFRIPPPVSEYHSPVSEHHRDP